MNLIRLKNLGVFSSLVFALLIFLITPYSLSNFALPFLCLFLIVKYCGSPKHLAISIHSLDLPLFLFMVFSAATYSFAVDSYLSLTSSLYFICMTLWVVLFKSDGFSKIKVAVVLKYVFVFNLLYVSFVSILFYSDLIQNNSWQVFFGANKNYTMTSLMILYPFVLFSKDDSVITRLLNTSAVLLLCYLLYVTNARGAIVAFVIAVLFKLYYVLNNSIFRYLLVFISLIIFFLVTAILLESDLLARVPIINEFGRSGDLSRLYMMKSSWKLFQDNYLLGTGLGNWHILGFSFDFSKIVGLSNLSGFPQTMDHNYFTRLLAEKGFFGFAFYVFSICIAFFHFLKKGKKISIEHRPWYLVVILYVVLSLFYLNANYNPYFFSRIQFMYFSAIAVLSAPFASRSMYVSKALKCFVVLLLMGIFLFFIGNEYSDIKIRKLIQDENIPELVSSQSSFLKKNSVGYKYLVPYELAKYYLTNGDTTNAKKYFKEASILRPYNHNVNLDYAELLLSGNESDLAKKYLDNVFVSNNKILRVNELYSKFYRDKNCNLYSQFTGLSSNQSNVVECDSFPLPIIGTISWHVNNTFSNSGGMICKNKDQSWTNTIVRSRENLNILNDGKLTLKVLHSENARIFGFTKTTTLPGHSTIDYGITLTSNNELYIWNCGVWIGRFGKYKVGDQIDIKRESSHVNYYKNDLLLYSSKYLSASPLYVMANILESDGCIEPIFYKFDNYDYSSHREFNVLK